MARIIFAQQEILITAQWHNKATVFLVTPEAAAKGDDCVSKHDINMLSRWARVGNRTNEDDSVSPEGEIQKVAFKSREAEEGGMPCSL